VFVFELEHGESSVEVLPYDTRVFRICALRWRRLCGVTEYRSSTLGVAMRQALIGFPVGRFRALQPIFRFRPARAGRKRQQHDRQQTRRSAVHRR
jgi:hypothetical protein